jgi:flagellar motor switch protein FliN/FliY
MTLNDSQTSALEAALSAAAENAGNTLSGLLGRAVTLTPAGVSGAAAADLGDKFYGGVAQVPVTVSGDAKGKALLAFNEASAALMADLLIGGDGSNPPEALSDLHLSAVGEVGNQAAAALFEGLSEGLGKKVSGVAGDLAPAQAGDLAGLVSGFGASLVLAEFSLEVEGGIPSPFLLVLGESVAATLAGAGGGAGAPAQKQQAPQEGGFSSGGFGGSMNAPVVQSAQLAQLAGSLPAGAASNLELLMDVPLQVTVELGRTQKMVKEVLALGPGSVLELDKLAGEPVDILVNEKPIAKGEVVVIDENFGIRVTEILAPKDRVSF